MLVDDIQDYPKRQTTNPTQPQPHMQLVSAEAVNFSLTKFAFTQMGSLLVAAVLRVDAARND